MRKLNSEFPRVRQLRKTAVSESERPSLQQELALLSLYAYSQPFLSLWVSTG